jgi:hypothetical protein
MKIPAIKGLKLIGCGFVNFSYYPVVVFYDGFRAGVFNSPFLLASARFFCRLERFIYVFRR